MQANVIVKLGKLEVDLDSYFDDDEYDLGLVEERDRIRVRRCRQQRRQVKRQVNQEDQTS